MKKYGVAFLILVLSLVLSLTGCAKKDTGAGNTANAQPVKLIAAIVTPKDGSYYAGMEKFKEIVEKETNGSVTVEIHPNGELGGNEDELVQKVATGTVDIAVASPGFMTQTVKQIDLFTLLYLFRDYDHWQKVMDGDVGQKMAKLVDDNTDFKALGWWKCGIRDYFGTKPVTEPDDLNGIKIRVQGSPAINETWSATGAQPARVAFNELYQALQNKVVDAGENDFANILQMKFYEVCPYISLTDHDIATRLFLISKKKYNSLTAEQKAAVDKAAVEATKYQRDFDNQLAQKALDQLKANGAKINTVDKAAFIEKTKPIREKVAKQLGLEDMLKEIENTK
ncbi:MAG: TRAP transporter substrate-binding protein [Bacillota bacterium]